MIVRPPQGQLMQAVMHALGVDRPMCTSLRLDIQPDAVPIMTVTRFAEHLGDWDEIEETIALAEECECPAA